MRGSSSNEMNEDHKNIHEELLSNAASINNIPENDEQQEISYTLLLKLCALGFFINFQPSESYLSSYLEDTKGFSDSQIDNNIWPYDTYGSLLSLLPVGLCAEHFGFRKVIFFGLLCREGTRLLLLFGTQLWQMSLMQFSYAMAISVNWVYYAYIYMVIIQAAKYQTVTSYVQSAMLLGTFLSSIFAQLLVSFTNLANNYTSLFYLSWISTSVALLSFCILPKPNRPSPISIFKLIKTSGVPVMLRSVRNMYFEKSGIVLQWSIWWIGGYSSYSIYSNYYQNQFIEYNKHGGDGYYGFVNGVMELVSVIGSLIPVYHSWRHIKSEFKAYKVWIVYSYPIILFSSFLIAAILLLSVIWRNLYVSYICNSLVFGIYHFQLACACSCIAYAINKNKSTESNGDQHYYAMLFTFNSFLGLIVATTAQSVGSVMTWTTSVYYLSCVLFYILTIVALLVNKYIL